MAEKTRFPLHRRVKTVPRSRRKHKVTRAMFGRPGRKGASFRDFYDSLPRILAATGLRAVVDAVVSARRRGKPVIAMMGGHVVKCGLSPVLIDLMRRGAVTAIAMNGATSIHDFEVALIGKTSENVQAGLERGTFGMARETGRMMNEALLLGEAEELGAGWALGRYILERRLPHREASLLAEAVRLRIPATVHIAIGTDIIHQHPQADGRIIGKTTMDDFRLLAEVVARLGNGGVVLHLGSAVVLPEVFLKALTVARSAGRPVRNFTAAVFDMLLQYRPLQNVVRRPVAAGGTGQYLLGHHEIMIPLLAQAIIEKL